MRIGQAIKQLREKAKISPKDFAHKTGITLDRLSGIETGLIEADSDFITLSCSILGFDPEKLTLSISVVDEKITKEVEEMQMACMNFYGHLKMAIGWYDTIWLHRIKMGQIDIKALQDTTTAYGKAKVACKQLERHFINGNDSTDDSVYEHLGKSISNMAKLNLTDRTSCINEVTELMEKYLKKAVSIQKN